MFVAAFCVLKYIKGPAANFLTEICAWSMTFHLLLFRPARCWRHLGLDSLASRHLAGIRGAKIEIKIRINNSVENLTFLKIKNFFLQWKWKKRVRTRPAPDGRKRTPSSWNWPRCCHYHRPSLPNWTKLPSSGWRHPTSKWDKSSLMVSLSKFEKFIFYQACYIKKQNLK